MADAVIAAHEARHCLPLPPPPQEVEHVAEA